MSVETILAFFGAALILAFVPGPDIIFVLTNSAIRGRTAGITIVLGLCTGLLFHTAAVALGVAALFQTSQVAFNVLKYAGAVYLLYLAWQAFRAEPELIDESADSARNAREFFFRGVIMNITNPKVSIFFLTFLPQFVDQSAGHVTLQMLGLGALFILATIIAFGFVAIFAASLGSRLIKSQKAQNIMNKVASVVFLGLALRLATTRSS